MPTIVIITTKTFQFDDLKVGRHFDDDATLLKCVCVCVEPNDASLEMD